MKYLKEYKNFIPIDIYENRNKIEIGKLNSIIIIILLGNIILFFMTIDKIKTIKENKNLIEYSINKPDGISLDEIVSWINLLNYSSESGVIENNKGTIKVENKNIDKINEKSKINSIKESENFLTLSVEEIK
ncbi:hypothetical protein [Clostridium thermobutyricum]|uniref:hypothetical protein n=1 Tax=Clostridium thermobutyricum TaxID=29372 RepID=UPI002943D947|nr:hypothetical protein [Clostridium thermobutyricum]